LEYIRFNTIASSIFDPRERKRIIHRAVAFLAEPDPSSPQGFKLFRRIGVKDLEVPHPSLRTGVVQRFHSIGHYARYRTTSSLCLYYWWSGMKNDVQAVVDACPACANSKAVFNSGNKELHPHPILGIGARVHVDLAGPFPESEHGNTYFMVMVCAFSKWAEVTPIPGKSAIITARVFHREWLCRYGACGTLVSDNGKEFEGAFKELLHQYRIDHRFTQPSNPQSNGQAEKLVGTIKKSLIRVIMSTSTRDRKQWETLLSTSVMGYNFTAQSSLRGSPFFAVFGRHPVFPSEVDRLFRQPVLDEVPDSADELGVTSFTAALLYRAEAIRQFTAFSFGNLQIAQHRQEMWYAQRRSGQYLLPTKAEFIPGQFAVTQTCQRRNLDTVAMDVILRVLLIRKDGTLVLQGYDGALLRDNCANWAPYHASAVQQPYVDRRMVLQRLASRANDADDYCPICCSADSENDTWVRNPGVDHRTVVCDWCATVYHLLCVKLPSLPQGNWYCPTCTAFNMPLALPLDVEHDN
jgi:hypothetical protein